MIELEICANSVASCIEAQRGGATRVELCAGIPEGGTTPSAGEMAMARRAVKIPIHAIIRPRAGDFVYSDMELETMCYDIDIARRCGADGVVFGCLRPDGSYDREANRELLRQAKGLRCTFHRAIDVALDPLQTLEELISDGFSLVLTSGSRATAIEGATLIAEMVRLAADRIGVMGGSGVRVSNIGDLVRQTNLKHIHSSLRSSIPGPMIHRNPFVNMGGTVSINEYERQQTDSALVSQAVQILHSIE